MFACKTGGSRWHSRPISPRLAYMRRTIHTIDGAKLRSKRDEMGFSARQLATKVDISETHMGRIEMNQRQPSPMVRKRITDALGIELADIAADAVQAA